MQVEINKFFCTLFQAFFSTIPSTQTKKIIGLFSFSWQWKIGLWTYISALYLFSKAFFVGVGRQTPPPGYT